MYVLIYTVGKEASVVGRTGKKRAVGREREIGGKGWREGVKNGGCKKTENRNRTKPGRAAEKGARQKRTRGCDAQ